MPVTLRTFRVLQTYVVDTWVRVSVFFSNSRLTALSIHAILGLHHGRSHLLRFVFSAVGISKPFGVSSAK